MHIIIIMDLHGISIYSDWECVGNTVAHSVWNELVCWYLPQWRQGCDISLTMCQKHVIMTKLRTSYAVGNTFICGSIYKYVLFQVPIFFFFLTCVTVLGYWKQLGMQIVNNTGIDDSRCTTQKAVACMYSRFQKSCNRYSWWWKTTSLASQTWRTSVPITFSIT